MTRKVIVAVVCLVMLGAAFHLGTVYRSRRCVAEFYNKIHAVNIELQQAGWNVEYLVYRICEQ